MLKQEEYTEIKYKVESKIEGIDKFDVHSIRDIKSITKEKFDECKFRNQFRDSIVERKEVITGNNCYIRNINWKKVEWFIVYSAKLLDKDSKEIE